MSSKLKQKLILRFVGPSTTSLYAFTNVIKLLHAMMALATPTLAHQKGGNNADALEYDQIVISGLNPRVLTSQDSYSDRAFFILTELLSLTSFLCFMR